MSSMKNALYKSRMKNVLYKSRMKNAPNTCRMNYAPNILKIKQESLQFTRDSIVRMESILYEHTNTQLYAHTHIHRRINLYTENLNYIHQAFKI